jgi:O-antigen/teichoic acid export membrane protein
VGAVADSGADQPQPVARVGRGGALNLVAAVVAAVLGIVLSVVITNSFSPSDAGLYFAATSLALILATVARLGTPVGLVYWISRLRSQARPAELGRVMGIALTPVLLLSLALGLLMALLAPELADWLFGGDPQVVGLLRALGALLPVLALSDVVMAATRGFGTMRATAVLDRVVRPALQLLLVLGAVLASASLATAGLGWALPYAVSAIAAALWVRRLLRRAVARQATSQDEVSGSEPMAEVVTDRAVVASLFAPPDPAEVETGSLRRRFWTFTWPRGFTSVVQAGLQRLDVILVSWLYSPQQAALYAVATRFLVVGQLTNSALGLAAQPQLASLISRGDRATANHMYRTTTAWIVLMNGPLYLIVAAFSPLLLSIFGETYSDAWPVTVVLCVAAFIGNGVGMVDVMLSMAGRTTWNLANAIVALGVQVGLDLLLIPTYGAFGAAIGWGASILAANLVPLTQLAVIDGLHPFGRGMALSTAVVLGTVGVPVLVCLKLLGQTWASLVVALVTAAVAYLVAVSLLRRPLGVAELVSALRRRGGGSPPPAPSGEDGAAG